MSLQVGGTGVVRYGMCRGMCQLAMCGMVAKTQYRRQDLFIASESFSGRPILLPSPLERHLLNQLEVALRVRRWFVRGACGVFVWVSMMMR